MNKKTYRLTANDYLYRHFTIYEIATLLEDERTLKENDFIVLWYHSSKRGKRPMPRPYTVKELLDLCGKEKIEERDLLFMGKRVLNGKRKIWDYEVIDSKIVNEYLNRPRSIE